MLKRQKQKLRKKKLERNAYYWESNYTRNKRREELIMRNVIAMTIVMMMNKSGTAILFCQHLPILIIIQE